MLVPQSMAYAVLAGVPPIYGLYASILPLLVYAFFGTSRHVSVGVVAIDMLIIASGIQKLPEGMASPVTVALTLTLMAGLIQLIFAVARLGFIMNFMSRPVIAGFTTAAPLIIATSQLGPLFGIDIPSSDYVFVLIERFLLRLDAIHYLTLQIGAMALVVLLLLKKWKPLVPGALIVSVIGGGLVFAFNLTDDGVAVVGHIGSKWMELNMPVFTFALIRELLPTAITLALVQFMTLVALGRVFATKHKYSIDSNKELRAIGIANVAGSFFSSLPITGSFSRSAVNEQAGARTPLSNGFAAIVVGLIVLFLSSYFYYLPESVLAAIIIMAALGMVDIEELRYLYHTKPKDGLIGLFTFLVTLIIGIQEGILLGVAASLVAVLYRISRPNIAVLGHLKGSRSFRDITRHKWAKPIEGLLILRVDASFSFANSEYLKAYILEKIQYDSKSVRAVVIDGSSINDIDTTAIEALHSTIEQLQKWNIDLYMTGLKSSVYNVLSRSGLTDQIGEDHIMLSPHRAIKRILKRWDEEAGSKDYPRLNGYLKQTSSENEDT